MTEEAVGERDWLMGGVTEGMAFGVQNRVGEVLGHHKRKAVNQLHPIGGFAKIIDGSSRNWRPPPPLASLPKAGRT